MCRWNRLVLLASTLLLIPGGCGSGEAESHGDCDPGQTSSCACDGGAEGVRVCLPGRTYGGCQCTDGGHNDAGTGIDGGGAAVADAVTADVTAGETVSDTGPDAGTGRVSATIGPDGGTLSIPGVTVVIRPGAVAAPVDMSLYWTGEDAASGYTAYSPVFALSPADLELMVPAEVRAEFTGDSARAALFWSRRSGLGYEWRGGSVEDGVLVRSIHSLGAGFVADGIAFTEPVDRSCVRSRLLESRVVDPSAIALFFTVDDCRGNPLTNLSADDFDLAEDGEPLNSEVAATILPIDGLQVFVTLVLDMSTSTQPNLTDLIAASKRFVQLLQVERGLPVQVSVLLFAGEDRLTEWQQPSLEPSMVLDRLDALADFVPTDPASTNLYGALIDAVYTTEAYQEDFEARNFGGALTAGYVVLFTDGKDSAALYSAQDALDVMSSSDASVAVVGLDSPDYDEAALAELAPGAIFSASDPVGLGVAFGALANRIAGQMARLYLLGYCSPKRSGRHTVTLQVRDAENRTSPAVEFLADGFGPGCSVSFFEQYCGDDECGGLACGACDDRFEFCAPSSMTCRSFCDLCGSLGESVNPNGYLQVCSSRGCCADSDCDDGDPCTADRCDLGSGACLSLPGEGCCVDADCDDGDLCNGASRCDTSSVPFTCVTDPETVVTCSAVGETTCARNECQAATGHCEPVPVNEGGSCDDGSSCTTGDICAGGQCVGDIQCGCEVDSDCEPIDGGNLCSGTYYCDRSVMPFHCVGPVDPVTCSTSEDSACLRNQCVPETGQCAMLPANEGGPCDDGLGCTGAGVCRAGECTAGVPISCADTDPCTEDHCDEVAGCVHSFMPGCCHDDADCADFDPCTDDICNVATGTCANPALPGCCSRDEDCDDADPCTTDTCDNATGDCDHIDVPDCCRVAADCVAFEDGNLCNGTLTCDRTTLPQVCAVDPATVVTCDDSQDTDCRANLCNPSSGVCSLRSINEDGACDDGDPCTEGTFCQSGTCGGGRGVCN